MSDEEYLKKYQKIYGNLTEEQKIEALKEYHTPMSDEEYLEKYQNAYGISSEEEKIEILKNYHRLLKMTLEEQSELIEALKDVASKIDIIEKALKLVSYFTGEEENVIEQKNDIIARSILDIIFSGKSPSEIRNKLTSVLTKFKTDDINLEVSLTKGGWSRTIRQCLYVEESGKFADIELVINYLEGFTQKEFQLTMPDGTFAYGLKEFALALEFALISEGVLTSEKIFDYANVLKIRLNTLINSDYAKYFDYPNYVRNNKKNGF